MSGMFLKSPKMRGLCFACGRSTKLPVHSDCGKIWRRRARKFQADDARKVKP